MILNDFEYQCTKERTEGFERALAMLKSPDNETRHKKPLLWKLHLDSVYSFLDDFTQQMREYESLTNWPSGNPIVFEIAELDDNIGRLLIKARLAAKISQKELADRLGIEEKVLQKYEDRDYQEVALVRVIEVMQALGIKISGAATLEFEAETAASDRLQAV